MKEVAGGNNPGPCCATVYYGDTGETGEDRGLSQETAEMAQICGNRTVAPMLLDLDVAIANE